MKTVSFFGIGIIALLFAATMIAAPAIASSPGSYEIAQAAPAAGSAEAKLADACKGKKEGDAVKVDGKDAKCPKAK